MNPHSRSEDDRGEFRGQPQSQPFNLDQLLEDARRNAAAVDAAGRAELHAINTSVYDHAVRTVQEMHDSRLQNEADLAMIKGDGAAARIQLKADSRSRVSKIKTSTREAKEQLQRQTQVHAQNVQAAIDQERKKTEEFMVAEETRHRECHAEIRQSYQEQVEAAKIAEAASIAQIGSRRHDGENRAKAEMEQYEAETLQVLQRAIAEQSKIVEDERRKRDDIQRRRRMLETQNQTSNMYRSYRWIQRIVLTLWLQSLGLWNLYWDGWVDG